MPLARAKSLRANSSKYRVVGFQHGGHLFGDGFFAIQVARHVKDNEVEGALVLVIGSLPVQGLLSVMASNRACQICMIAPSIPFVPAVPSNAKWHSRLTLPSSPRSEVLLF